MRRRPRSSRLPFVALFVLNDPAYGTERSFNGLRLADVLAKQGRDVRVFLLVDAVTCAMSDQKVPTGQ